MSDPADFRACMNEMRAEAQKLIDRIAALPPGKPHATLCAMFNKEAPDYEAKARLAREMADTLQMLADAMRAKTGEVQA